MDLETIASLAAVASCVIGYLTYKIQKNHFNNTAKEKSLSKSPNDSVTKTNNSRVNLDGRQQHNVFNSHAVAKIQEFSVAKIPYFAKSTIEKIYGFVFNLNKNNSGLYAWGGYGVGFVFSHNDHVFTSCDCLLAVNVWSKLHGCAITRLEGDSQSSYSTTFMRLSPCGRHIIFGNGRSLFYSCDLSKPVRIKLPEFEFKSAFFDKHGSFLFVHKDEGKLHLSKVSCSEMPEPTIKKVLDITEVSSDPLFVAIKYLAEWGDSELICAYRFSPWYTSDEVSRLIIYDRENRKKLSDHEINGLQELHFDEKKERIYALSNEVSVYDENFNKIFCMELEQRWSQSGSWVLGSIAGRPCGKLVAYSIYNDGEISICSFPESKVVKKIKSIGIYNKYLQWSSSGRYLAYLSYDEDSRDHYFDVYDYSRDEDVYRHATHFHITGNPVEEWTNAKYEDELMILKDASWLEWLRFR